jgi:nitrite reductase/ring-hydroxylating ferredoxin subunit
MVWLPTDLSLAQLRGNGNRAHTVVDGRRVTVIALASIDGSGREAQQLYCIDTACGHAGGPLGAGAIEDIENVPCIRCPWHNYVFALDTGERVHREFELPDGPPSDGCTFTADRPAARKWPTAKPGSMRRGRREQRVFPVAADAGSGVISIDFPATFLGHVASDAFTAPEGQRSPKVVRKNKVARGPSEPRVVMPYVEAPPLVLPKRYSCSSDEGGPPDPRSATPPPQ